MTAAQAGWPNGQPTVAASNKAAAVAQAIGGRPHPVWYDQWQPHQQGRHDLVCRSPTNGASAAYRTARRAAPPARDHFAELDCRASPASTRPGRLHRLPPPRHHDPADAVLNRTARRHQQQESRRRPPVPVRRAAGLMLAAALAALPNGPAMTGRMNDWQLDLTLSTPLLRHHQHQQRLARREQPSAALRRLIREFEPHRWDYLDHADE